MGRLTEYIYFLNNPRTTKERYFWIDCDRVRTDRKAELSRPEPKKTEKFNKADIFRD
jgi:hypothetical protein